MLNAIMLSVVVLHVVMCSVVMLSVVMLSVVVVSVVVPKRDPVRDRRIVFNFDCNRFLKCRIGC